jgi:ribosomal-protein-alanine N-acetyltransferase
MQLRCLREEEVTERYVAWLSDPVVNQYVESRFQSHHLESTREYVRAVNRSPDSLLLGMFVDAGQKHIGNIKLGPINAHHHRADIGLLIGDRDEWGRGYATEAIGLVTAYGFGSLKLQKLTAGCYCGNEGSLKAFQRAGYDIEASLARHWHTAQGLQDGLLLGMTLERYASWCAAQREKSRSL